MADEIHLMEGPAGYHGPEMQRARAYTAWGLFCWQRYVRPFLTIVPSLHSRRCSLSSYHYLKTPLIKEPPHPPLPSPLEQPQWYGELWVKYPLSQSRVPTYHGLLFKAKCDFWGIMNDFSLLRFSHQRSATNLTVDQIFTYYNRLQAWLHDLPEPLTPRKVVLPHQLKMHMHYNHMLIDLFTPIVQYTGIDGTPLAKTPREVYQEAVSHLETIIRLYYLRHGFEAFDGFLLHFLGTLCHLTMNAVEAGPGSPFLESRRSTILLLMKGIHDQGRSHFVARAILRLQMSLMRPEDVELLKRFVEIEADQMACGPLEQAVHTDWPSYDFGLEAKAEQFKQGRNLASRLASLSLESSTSRTPTRSPA